MNEYLDHILSFKNDSIRIKNKADHCSGDFPSIGFVQPEARREFYGFGDVMYHLNALIN
jgi:hypothetical protein